jgi:hypothetical protein
MNDRRVSQLGISQRPRLGGPYPRTVAALQLPPPAKGPVARVWIAHPSQDSAGRRAGG